MSATNFTLHQNLADRAREITRRELQKYAERTTGSQAATARAKQVLPLGVPSSLQYYDPHPVVVRHAAGARMIDVDGNEYVDYNMGFGALFAGHVNPFVREAIERQLDDGTLYVTPAEITAVVGELLAQRFQLPLWRFTNSGTEATMDAIRVARGATGRDKIVKVEGGYHGHHDTVMVSMKPPIDAAGPADHPFSVPSTAGVAKSAIADTIVIPYNDAAALEEALAGNDVAAFIVEPVMENIGICMPEAGYLENVRRITREHGTMLIFDEVKTGITAGWGGATGVLGVVPDLVCLAKSIGGGLPLGAFGGTRECMEQISNGRVVHMGTYNGNPLVMAAAVAVLSHVCTPEVTNATVTRNARLIAACDDIISRASLPAHTVQFGAKGCITWAETPIRNYRDYKSTDFDIAFAQWIHGVNRGILLPPGLDEQWLISVMHSEEEALRYANVFGEFVDELTA
jgi:glutamate-1-semialdehyde 2,1-aminomutase